MLKKLLVSLICLMVNIVSMGSAYGRCPFLQGRWEGDYVVKPEVFGMPVGVCEYNTVMDILPSESGEYQAIVKMIKTGGEGRAVKKCDTVVTIEAVMVCENNTIFMITDSTAIGGHQNVELTLLDETLNSEGKFKMKKGAYTVKADYTLDVAK